MNHQTRRRRRRRTLKINRRIRRRTLDIPCDLCKLIFSREGLQYLSSFDGLRHHTRASCAASRDEGCQICKFIFLAVCKDHDRDWDDNDHLVFRNFPQRSSTNIPGIYSLQCTFEGGLADCIITINTFAREGLHYPSYRQSIQITDSSKTIPWAKLYSEGLYIET